MFDEHTFATRIATPAPQKSGSPICVVGCGCVGFLLVPPWLWFRYPGFCMDDLVLRVLSLDATARSELFGALSWDERVALMRALEGFGGNPWARFREDPVGFVERGLGEVLWSKQREILEAVRDEKRVAVPACHAPGKTHLAARAIAWWIACHPPGTAQVVTTATTFRQVRNLLWVQVRRLHSRHRLPGETSQVEWKIGSDIVGYGFSAPAWDETAVQGVHAPHLLVVVDEAGGISNKLGQSLEALMTGGHTRLLVIGNPAVDIEDSWFERACESPLYRVIPISAFDTPNFTGEETDVCGSCPVEVAEHRVASHLVDREWVDDVFHEFGQDSPFAVARVLAKFPKAAPNKVIPLSWVESSTENDHPVAGDELRLGVDVAADGGDELVIARADGFRVKVIHTSSGQANASAVDVAGMILEKILETELIALGRSHKHRVIVKIDAIGVGWGVAGLLQQWGKEGRHRSQIVPVNVSRSASSTKFKNQRAELWWNGRQLLMPDPENENAQQVRLDVDRRAMAQLSSPMYSADSAGRIVIESKREIKRRSGVSPDRAEAILLALYQPPGQFVGEAITPIVIDQISPWDLNSI